MLLMGSVNVECGQLLCTKLRSAKRSESSVSVSALSLWKRVQMEVHYCCFCEVEHSFECSSSVPCNGEVITN
jgi:hypothetical protein